MLHTETTDGLTTLRLAHGKASALDLEFLRALRSACGEFARSDARALLLTGTGSIFSAGVDLRRLVEGGRDYAAEFLPELEGLLLDLFACEKPVVAALNGHAIAGGCALALAADLRLLAAGRATLGVPELAVGVPFPPSVIEVVRFALPPQHARVLLLGARVVGADEALLRGLVDEVVPADELPARALAAARAMAAIPSPSFALSKRQLRAPALERMRERSAAMADAMLEAWCCDEVTAAVRRYVEATLGPRAGAGPAPASATGRDA